MASLDWNDALNLAASLTTIGHPYLPAAINATALDLQRLCTGYIRDGRAVPPGQQALELITVARTGWEDGWPDKGGTASLYRLFRELFNPGEAASEFKAYEAPPPPSCERCSDTGWESTEVRGYTYSKLCTVCGGKRKPAAVCPDCGGKETRLEPPEPGGRRVPCACLSPSRRAKIAEWLTQQKDVS